MTGTRNATRLSCAGARGWAVKWISNSHLDGRCEHLCGGAAIVRPAEFGGYQTMVFESRAAARAYVRSHYSYIAKRPDLKAEPHGWKIPRVVPVDIMVAER